MAAERDYVLGTREEELARLGLQHRVCGGCFRLLATGRNHSGKRVLDVGAGPATRPLILLRSSGPLEKW